MKNNEYMFGVSTKPITKTEARRRDKIARRRGGAFVGPLNTPENSGRSWFAIENKGEPFNGRAAKTILAECGL